MERRWALFSVWDKTGAVEFARVLVRGGYGILATSKTAGVLEGAGIAVTEVGKWTGAGEILEGRVKTLHPKVAAGILARRKEGIEPIDFVVCNLYPFAQGRAAGRGVEEMVELIDIGGVTLLRAAAKNWFYVTPVPGPEFYPRVIAEFEATGRVSERLRLELAQRTFQMTSDYDRMIAGYLADIIDR